MRHFISIVENTQITPGRYYIEDLPPELRQKAIEAFQALGKAQRHGPPEKLGGASLANKGMHVSGLYASLTEHVGDITHRMTEFWQYPHPSGGYETVKDKVLFGLRRLNPDGLSDLFIGNEIVGQVERNYKFQSHPDRDTEREKYPESRRFDGSLADWKKWWREAGERYATAHAALTVWNEAQWHAREAAVACGRLDWKAAYAHLTALQAHLQNQDHWTHYAGQVTVGPNFELVPFDH